MNKEDSFKAVVDYIDAQFEAYLQEELKIKRSLPTYHDSRLHVCLYFICPTGELKLFFSVFFVVIMLKRIVNEAIVKVISIVKSYQFVM